MDQLPIFLTIKDRKCVIVGGGNIALRKAELLLLAGANLHVVATQVGEGLQKLCDDHAALVETKDYDASALKDAALVIAATDNQVLNRQVSLDAKELNIPVNVVDQPALCSFIMPAIVDRSPVIVAISSGGASPVLTRKIKELIETFLPERISALAKLLGSYRERVKNKLAKPADRARFWENILDSKVSELVYSSNDKAAAELIEQQLTDPNCSEAISGEVYLVGAGPGDPDLLTLRALRLMHKADVVLYDRLVSAEIMAKLRRDAQKIHVGKEQANHSVEQETINQMLVRFARDGKKVLRLKGGDPFIFGRGGEELETLTEAGVPFQIVPGITAASGCAAYAGIPLTHRDYAQSVRFVTGHTKEGAVALDWETLAKEQQTLVFYMGLSGLSEICKQLIDNGMEQSMPIALIQQGTTATQKVLVGDLSNMPMLAESKKVQAPTIIIVGRVVELQKKLSWFNV
ncbi:MAG: uroporphyrinogen-III C-methyltransferase [SAR86 cluster bacterium]|uniref:Siroheme synthase n=1 Tax=SAR86 cluster bacterium TaxID=2030880 RepID=A0A2A5B3G1_9GAMM|nr:MAG: uroporphyrinogen-III C-methyltransferase [SAR86 cluster bacterium]